MNRPAFTKCTMVDECIRIARTIKHCLNAVRSIARTSRAQSSVSKWVETCVNTANNVHGVAWRSVAAADRIASTAHDVHGAASRSVAAVVSIVSMVNNVHSVASRNAVAAGRIASTANHVQCVASRSVAAVARIASTGNGVHGATWRSAAVAVRIASTSRVTAPGKCATSATRVLRKGTLHTYAENDDTMRS